MAEAWAEAVLAERRRTRESLVAKARAFVEQLVPSGQLLAAVIYGSVARGDFNVWSDVDLLLVLRSLPTKPPDRVAALIDRAPPGIQIIAWTPEQFVLAHRRRNPIALEAMAAGEVLHGKDAMRSLAAPDR